MKYWLMKVQKQEADIWNNILDKSTLQWFQTLVFRLYVYNCGILRQEDKFRRLDCCMNLIRVIYMYLTDNLMINVYDLICVMLKVGIN